jgi:hypothetical protein
MNNTALITPAILAEAPVFKRRRDPILEELWAVKAQLNAAANYDVKRLLEDARDSVAKMRAQGLI